MTRPPRNKSLLVPVRAIRTQEWPYVHRHPYRSHQTVGRLDAPTQASEDFARNPGTTPAPTRFAPSRPSLRSFHLRKRQAMPMQNPTDAADLIQPPSQQALAPGPLFVGQAQHQVGKALGRGPRALLCTVKSQQRSPRVVPRSLQNALFFLRA